MSEKNLKRNINNLMSDNVLEFPKDRIVRKIAQTSDEEKKNVARNKAKFVERILDHYGIALINKLAVHGFNPEDDKFMYDYIFTMETLRSCLYRNVGLYHPLQKLSDHSEEIVHSSDLNLDSQGEFDFEDTFERMDDDDEKE